ncbi:MAG: SDR family oxidoreductase [Rhodocyclaceae bacterium]|jgi:NAD(P)-dependent dehydrogenase (short-subunit alcohol dehydrogenase family)|nr:SDR family oxidoreductase [Rhodocyclaceae bacterium]
MTSKDNSPVPDYPNLLRLDGRNLIVAGAGQGMGRQSCHALRQAGANLLCVDFDPRLAEEIAAEVGGVAFCGDMTQEGEVKRLVETAAQHFGGAIHGFVDIIGVAQWEALIDMDESVWDAQFDVCLKHAYFLSKHVGGHMASTGTPGTMVFIASVHGLTASIRHAAYGAAKAGLISLVRSLAYELGPKNIRVNAVAPGSILTPRISAMLDEAGKAAAARRSPLNKLGIPADIAASVLFLSSPLAGFVTGQTLVVDGGAVVADPYVSL